MPCFVIHKETCTIRGSLLRNLVPSAIEPAARVVKSRQNLNGYWAPLSYPRSPYAVMPTTSTLAINGSLVILATYLFAKWLKPRALPGIPHYPVTSIWGDLPALGKERDQYGSPFEPGAFFSASHERLGPLYQVSAHGCNDSMSDSRCFIGLVWSISKRPFVE